MLEEQIYSGYDHLWKESVETYSAKDLANVPPPLFDVVVDPKFGKHFLIYCPDGELAELELGVIVISCWSLPLFILGMK